MNRFILLIISLIISTTTVVSILFTITDTSHIYQVNGSEKVTKITKNKYNEDLQNIYFKHNNETYHIVTDKTKKTPKTIDINNGKYLIEKNKIIKHNDYNKLPDGGPYYETGKGYDHLSALKGDIINQLIGENKQ